MDHHHRAHTALSWQDLKNSAKKFGNEYIANEARNNEASLLRGNMKVHELEQGVLLYRTQVEDLCDIRTSHILNPGLKVLLLLEGATQVRYGSEWVLIDASQAPRGLVVNLVQPDVFMRQWMLGRAERKLVLSFEPNWLEERGILQSVPWLQVHLSRIRWQPSRKAIALAEQLHHEAELYKPEHSLQRLSWLTKVQAILVEALESVLPKPIALNGQKHPRSSEPKLNRLSVQAYRNLVVLREWLTTTACDGLRLQEIAKHAGMSVSYLQRYFGEVAHGQSVSQFLRSQRLHRACRSLENDGVSVMRAAEIAGYSSVTHFTKAFRKAYGCAPSQWRSGA